MRDLTDQPDGSRKIELFEQMTALGAEDRDAPKRQTKTPMLRPKRGSFETPQTRLLSKRG